jgi:hypothetical protein
MFPRHHTCIFSPRISREHSTVMYFVLVILQDYDKRICEGVMVSRIILLLFLFIFLYTECFTSCFFMFFLWYIIGFSAGNFHGKF